jgi:hypothetical protein
MILGENDKRRTRETLGRRATATPKGGGIVPLIQKAFGKDSGKIGGSGEILIVSFPFPCQENMKGMVEIVTPLAMETNPVMLFRKNRPAIVLMGLSDQMDSPSSFFGDLVGKSRDIGQKWHRRLVYNGMNGIEPKPVDIKDLKIISDVFQKKMTDMIAPGTIEVNGIAPRGPGNLRKIGGKFSQIVPFWPQMIIDNVQNDGNAPFMTGPDKTGKAVGPSI